jgi:serine/threonine protein kinase
MEACGMSLKEAESKQPGGYYQPLTAFKICIQLVERIKSLHSINIVHGDLKLQNVVEGPAPYKEKIYLIDFGSSLSYNK